MSFSTEIIEWRLDTKKNVTRIRKAIILALFTKTILRTPVLTGQLRYNWFTTDKSPSNRIAILEPLSEAEATRRATSRILTNIGKQGSVFLTNNMPYAERIELDGWSHEKAPEGMVRVSFNEIIGKLPTIIKKA